MSADVDKLMRSILWQALTSKERDYDMLVAHIQATAGEENVAAVLKQISDFDKNKGVPLK